MDIKIDSKEIISISEFELSERFLNSIITKDDLDEITPLSINESKRLNKIIDFYKTESYLISNFNQTDWFTSNQESEQKIEKFREIVSQNLLDYEENLIISWNRNIALKSSKTIFLKYWYIFLKPTTDNVTIISENTNWILFFSHYGVSNLWCKK